MDRQKTKTRSRVNEVHSVLGTRDFTETQTHPSKAGTDNCLPEPCLDTAPSSPPSWSRTLLPSRSPQRAWLRLRPATACNGPAPLQVLPEEAASRNTAASRQAPRMRHQLAARLSPWRGGAMHRVEDAVMLLEMRRKLSAGSAKLSLLCPLVQTQQSQTHRV